MQVTVFGSTGEAGRLLVHRALERGHRVVAFARNPSKIEHGDPALIVVEGELDDQDAIERAITGSEAIISLLGPSPRGQGTPVADGTALIISAMGSHAVRRLIVTATPSAADTNDRSKLRFRMAVTLVRRLMPHSYREIIATAATVRASDLDWTIARLPMLTNRSATGAAIAGYIGDPGIDLFWLSRSTLVDFLLDQLDNEVWIHAAPVISNP